MPSATGQRGIIEINAFVVAGSGDSIQKSQLSICMHIAAMHTTHHPPATTDQIRKGKHERPQEVNKNDGRRLVLSAFYLINWCVDI